MQKLITSTVEVSDAVLAAVAHIPTRSLPVLMDDQATRQFGDADLMRIEVLLAQKSYDEGGFPSVP